MEILIAIIIISGILLYSIFCFKWGYNCGLNTVKTLEPTDNAKIEELDADYYEDQPKGYTIRAIIKKLNEVINKVNAQTTVVLSQEKDIEDIKNQLDY